jgi:hypothetical protein
MYPKKEYPDCDDVEIGRLEGFPSMVNDHASETKSPSRFVRANIPPNEFVPNVNVTGPLVSVDNAPLRSTNP